MKFINLWRNMALRKDSLILHYIKYILLEIILSKDKVGVHFMLLSEQNWNLT